MRLGCEVFRLLAKSEAPNELRLKVIVGAYKRSKGIFTRTIPFSAFTFFSGCRCFNEMGRFMEYRSGAKEMNYPCLPWLLGEPPIYRRSQTQTQPGPRWR